MMITHEDFKGVFVPGELDSFLEVCQEEAEFLTYLDRPVCIIEPTLSYELSGDIRLVVLGMLDDLEHQKTPLPYDVWFRMCRKYMNKEQWDGSCYSSACAVLPNVPHEAPTPEQEEAARNMPPRVPDSYW